MRVRLSDLYSPRLPGSIGWDDVSFGLRTTCSSLVALYIGFLINLDDPKWAAMTVWIVAQRSRSGSLTKGQFRIIGTLTGAVVAMSLMAGMAQHPEMFILGMALWLGICAATATALRDFKEYAVALSGYSAAIVAFSAVTDPENVFYIALSRVSYICLGIVCEAVFTAILAPEDTVSIAKRRLHAYRQTVSRDCALALKGEDNHQEFRQLFSQVAALGTLVHYAEVHRGIKQRKMRHFRAAMLMTQEQLAATQSLHDHLIRHPDDADMLVDDTIALLERDNRELAQDDAGGDVLEEASCLIRRIEAAIDEEMGMAPSYTRLLMLDRLKTIVSAYHKACYQQQRIDTPESHPERPHLSYYVDYRYAIQSFITVFAGVMAAGAIWIDAAWPLGARFITIYCVMCTLYVTRPSPSAGAMGFLKGGIAGVVAAGIVNFGLLGYLYDFIPFAFVLGLFLFLSTLVRKLPMMAAPATSFPFLFLDWVSPTNIEQLNAEAFFNNSIGMSLGIIAAVVSFAIAIPADPLGKRQRVERASRKGLFRLCDMSTEIQQPVWLMKMTDRIRVHAATDQWTNREEAEAGARGMLSILTMGHAVIRLKQLMAQDDMLHSKLQVALRTLSRGGDFACVSGLVEKRLQRTIMSKGMLQRNDVYLAIVYLHEITESLAFHGAAFLHHE